MDLASIRAYLQLKYGRDTPRLQEIEFQYVSYLDTAATTNQPLPVPSQEVDAMWHAHILHTREYNSYCVARYGGIIHHIPNSDQSGVNEHQFREPCCALPSKGNLFAQASKNPYNE